MESIVEFDRVGKRFFNVTVLRDVSFPVTRGHMLGLVGENGAGKSTLMNILGGVIAADSGVVRLDGKNLILKNPQQAGQRGIAFIHQELNLFPNLTIAENLFIPHFPANKIAGLGFINRRSMREQAKKCLRSVGLDLSPDIVVADLKPGECQLVEIAKALNADARIVIFDEPTSSLSRPDVERLFLLMNGLRSRGMSMIYISHILGDVLKLCDDICVLRDGQVVAHGPKDEFSSERMISLMTGRSFDNLYPRRDTIPSDEPALEVRCLSQPGVVENLNLTLYRGEVVGLFGLMGSGRTELVRMIFGLDTFEQGEIALGGSLDRQPAPRESIRRGLAFLTEDRRVEGLCMDASVEENIALVALSSFASSGVIHKARLRKAVADAGDAVSINIAAVRKQPVKTLSGGSQQKVVLAKWLLSDPAVLILDEPTRGIDVGAKYEVYRLINQCAEEGKAILFVSSEIEELLGVCDRILVIRAGEVCDCVTRAEFNAERILRSAFGARSVQ
ncbi:MAG: sugar ABC transporter ATP-binding protein [Terriglobales bacterium]